MRCNAGHLADWPDDGNDPADLRGNTGSFHCRPVNGPARTAREDRNPGIGPAFESHGWHIEGEYGHV